MLINLMIAVGMMLPTVAGILWAWTALSVLGALTVTGLVVLIWSWILAQWDRQR